MTACVLSAAPECGAHEHGNRAIEPLEVETIHVPNVGGNDTPLQLTVRDDRSWRGAWERLWPDGATRPPLPAVDFSKKMVVIATLGTRPSGGFTIDLIVADAGDHISAHIIESTPDASCVTTQAITHPKRVAAIAKQNKEVRFDSETRVRRCN